MSRTDPPLLILAGPTSSGKSGAALLLARALGAEIVSADSMMVYRGMDIGTAKPSVTERALVPHHLLDVVDMGEPFDAADYRRRALEAMADIRGRGKTPLVVGGTGMYLKALTHGLEEGIPADPAFRAQVEGLTPERLLAMLEEHGPHGLNESDRRNPRRLVRALEICRATGRPLTEARRRWAGEPVPYRCLCLWRCKSDLDHRIGNRVDEMFAAGLVAEVEGLMARGLETNLTACQAIGYRQVIDHLRGKMGLEECRELVKIRTRQYARRQITWFGRQAGLEKVCVGPDDGATELAGELERRLLIHAKS